MSTTYVGLAIADSMFPPCCSLTRTEASLPLVLKMLEDNPQERVVNCCNPSHVATLQALRERHGIDLTLSIAEKPPTVKLMEGDFLLVLSVRGLPRLTNRHEYTADEVAGATFSFGVWHVEK